MIEKVTYKYPNKNMIQYEICRKLLILSGFA